MQNLLNGVLLLLALPIAAAALLLVLALVVEPQRTRSALRRWRAGRKDQ